MNAAVGRGASGIPALAGLEREARIVTTPCGDGRMVWRVFGSGPPLVLLHGGYGSWNHWFRTIPAFAPTRTLYVPDLPSLGDSAEVPEPADPPTVGAVVRDGLVHAGLDPARLDVVGFSFGALVAGHVAALGPVRSLMLVGAGALDLPRMPVELLREEEGMSEAERRAIHRANLAHLMVADPSLIDEDIVSMQAANVARARLKSRRFARTNSLAEALAVTQAGRIHAVWGERDIVVGPHMKTREDYVRTLAVPTAFSVIPGAGHWAPYEASDLFDALLRDWLAAVSASAETR